MIKEKSHTWTRISLKLGQIFSHLPFPPSYYTWLTVPIALLGLLAIRHGYLFCGVLAFIVAGILDVLDGAVARHTQRTSHAGAFLDGSLDRFIDFFLIFSYFWVPIKTPWFPLSHWICMAIFFAIMPSFEVAYANHRRAVHDPEEKIIWRLLNRGEMYVLMLLIPVVSIFSSIWAGYLLVMLVGLSIITTLQTLFSTIFHARLSE
jgi:archaetidylinositol phosphate synthase